MSSESIIRVPASTSNLGSGFDTLGLAVNLYTRVEARRTRGTDIRLASDVPEEARNGLTKLLSDAATRLFRSSQTEPFGIETRLSGNVPIARGLGYSATVRVGVLAALNELSGTKLDRSSLLNLATQLEGHPDNASPSIFGGFTVSGIVERERASRTPSPLTPALSPLRGEGEEQPISQEVRCLHFAVPEALRLVTLVPEFPISTEEARKLMPSSFSRIDAAHGLNRAALITAAFASGDLKSLRGVFDDRIHQPYRERLIPKLRAVIEAGEEAGALGGFLSGSGSAIICLALDQPERIGEAMQRILPDSQILVLAPDNHGFVVE